MNLQTYTISIFTDNTVGLLNRITIIFTRRRINIESLTVSETERTGISRFTIVIRQENRETVEKLVRQIRKIIEVHAVFGYLDDEIIYNEIAVFKIKLPKNGHSLDFVKINTEFNVKVIYLDSEFVVIEKNGSEKEIHDFFKYIKPYGILEFLRSGRIAVGKTPKGLVEFLPDLNEEYAQK